MLGEENFIDTIMQTIMNAILSVIKVVFSVIFSSKWVALLFWMIVINIIAIVLMKKDKRYAQEDKRRIRESTLLMVALAGGAIGMYYAMFKYKHKTLHKKFTIWVPVFIVLHFACISYFIFSSFI